MREQDLFVSTGSKLGFRLGFYFHLMEDRNKGMDQEYFEYVYNEINKDIKIILN